MVFETLCVHVLWIKVASALEGLSRLLQVQIYNLHLLLLQIKILDDIIAEMDQKTGEYRCKFAIEHLDYLDEKQEDPLISQCKMLHCEGTLKNNRGTVGTHCCIFSCPHHWLRTLCIWSLCVSVSHLFCADYIFKTEMKLGILDIFTL